MNRSGLQGPARGPARQAAVRAALVMGAVLLLQVACGLPARADSLDDIRRRGELVVGVKKDVPLWGMMHPRTGQLVGLEPDLAQDLASQLGVRLRMVGVLTADRLEMIEQRRIDVLIATLSDTPERRQRVTLVLPHYYASGTNILSRRELGFQSWGQLRNRRVCGRRGAFYNRDITVNYGADIVALYSNSLALQALRDGRCDALVYDDTNIIAMLQDPRWTGSFEMPLQTLYITPWAIALHQQEQGTRLYQFVSQAVAHWHMSGKILALERQWGIPASSYAQQMNKAWGRSPKQPDHCALPLLPNSPKDCL